MHREKRGTWPPRIKETVYGFVEIWRVISEPSRHDAAPVLFAHGIPLIIDVSPGTTLEWRTLQEAAGQVRRQRLCQLPCQVIANIPLQLMKYAAEGFVEFADEIRFFNF